jgi:hypothetical protein
MKLKIHSWGGLGSQLHALSIAHDLKQNFPTRKLVLIHHTSGVSRRFFELESILDKNIELKVVDDFREDKIHLNNGRRYKEYCLRIIKSLLKQFLVIVYIDDCDFSQIKFWTVEIRGHYSKKNISDEFFKNCIKMFSVNEEKHKYLKNALVIHYRLGDLLKLTEKSIISSEQLIGEIKIALESNKYKQVVIYSDSIEVAKQKLIQLDHFFKNITYSNAPTIEVIKNAINVDFFIGTNSKVSFWIERFRRSIGKPSLVIGK